MKLNRWLDRPAGIFAAALLALLGLTSSAEAREDVIIRRSHVPMTYDFELEPHLVLGTAPLMLARYRKLNDCSDRPGKRSRMANMAKGKVAPMAAQNGPRDRAIQTPHAR